MAAVAELQLLLCMQPLQQHQLNCTAALAELYHMSICACCYAGSRSNALAWWVVQCDIRTPYLDVLAKAAAAMLWAGMVCAATPMSSTSCCAHDDAGSCNNAVAGRGALCCATPCTRLCQALSHAGRWPCLQQGCQL